MPSAMDNSLPFVRQDSIPPATSRSTYLWLKTGIPRGL
jgi:hypothetical protein